MSKLAMKLIDIGSNLTDPVFRGVYRDKQRHVKDLDRVLTRAKDNRVEKIIITGGSLSESREALKICQELETDSSPELFCTVGVHPTRGHELAQCGSDGRDVEIRADYFNDLLTLCKEGMSLGKIVAIGECGLDYDRLQFCSKEIQIISFEKQFELAEETGLPMFFHNRNTKGDFYDAIVRHRHRFRHGVVHSFTGSKEEVLKLLALGLYIGINGCSLKTRENLDVLPVIPLNRLLLETDAPWCDIRPTHAGYKHVQTTWPVRKSEKYEAESLVKGRNEPCALKQVLEIVCAQRDEDPQTLAEQVYRNTEHVFFASSIQ